MSATKSTPTSADVLETRIAIAHEWLATHKATSTMLPGRGGWPIERVEFGRRAEGGGFLCNYYLHYLITGSHLVVTGDLHAAVYQWSRPVCREFVAGCELEYFAGKCIASPTGNGEEWDARYAEAGVRELLADPAEDWPERTSPYLGDSAFDCLGTRDEWRQWLARNGDEVFGDDSWEYGSIGETVSMTTIGHWLGIRLAHEQLTAAGS